MNDKDYGCWHGIRVFRQLHSTRRAVRLRQSSSARASAVVKTMADRTEDAGYDGQGGRRSNARGQI
jgi:hypothetical protein